MSQTVQTGYHAFNEIRDGNLFYIDKTSFIREWWESGQKVTLITRPRRFGKTLNMNMLECFFSNIYAGRGDFFEGLEIWKDENYRALQGTLPVISLSFAKVKDSTFSSAMDAIRFSLGQAFRQHGYIKESPDLPLDYKKMLQEAEDSLLAGGRDGKASRALLALSEAMAKVEKKGVIILLDEYDAPLQEAWMNGYWKEMSSFMRTFFNSTFKDNSFLERGILTGVTRMSRESMFSDLNNLDVSSILTGRYETSFGFTESEVFAALKQYGLSDREEEVREMYDGFIFGSQKGIYNPWSINKYLQSGGDADLWWANTSSNDLIRDITGKSSCELREDFSCLVGGGTVRSKIDERMVLNRIKRNPDAFWGLLLECGYLKPLGKRGAKYELEATNKEVRLMLAGLMDDWFSDVELNIRDDFLDALLAGDLGAMNKKITQFVDISVSTFDSGNKPSDYSPPERFFQGLMLGMLASLHSDFHIKSNDIQGAGRCDIMLVPRNPRVDDGIILEFKVCAGPKQMEATAAEACSQIEEMRYDAGLKDAGLPQDRIHKYGFVFHGKDVIIRGK